ncbi:MAG TPA: PD-(D/E)XK nuclease family protein [Pseudonocardiaceae bacterium]|jgi:hypothetical protein|nr:PD-(D/E)XK nuclease family protein [Pseudonocardiaceae bacterium]
MPPEHGAFIDGVVRQSTLRGYDKCPLRAVHEARAFDNYSNPWAALGTAFHMVAEECLRTLARQGEKALPPQEAVEIGREVVARDDCPHLSDSQLRELHILIIMFSSFEWTPARILAIEKRLYAEVPCPDGITRRITGKPDVLLADPPKGIIYLDFKTGWAIPSTPKDGDFSRDNGRRYLSDGGTFQLDTGGLLIMSEWPGVDRVTLREYYPRLNEVREAVLHRAELEHVEHRLGLLAMRFERSMKGQLEPEPRPWPGYCSHCPMVRACPIPAEARGTGVLSTIEDATAEATRWVVVKALAEQQRRSLKAFHESADEPRYIPAPGGLLGWHEKPGGGREFKIKETATT